MLGSEIKLLIVDFDGTLVDTFRANFMACHIDIVKITKNKVG